MKKYIFLLCLLAVMLISFTAYAATNGGILRSTDAEQEHGMYADHETIEAIGITEMAQAGAVQTDSWQEAYAEKLLYYAQLPTGAVVVGTAGAADSTGATWRFMLHDIDQDGVPELFIVVYYDGLVDHRGVYSFSVEYGLIRLKANISGEVYGGMIIPPGGAAGIIRFDTLGHIQRYVKSEISGGMLANVALGTFICIAEYGNQFRIDHRNATEGEFEGLFGLRGWDYKDWLTMHDITDANIRDVIFGW